MLQVEQTLKHSWPCYKNIYNENMKPKHPRILLNTLKDSCYLLQNIYGIWQGFGSLLGSSYYTNMIFLGTRAVLPQLQPEFSHAYKYGVGDGCLKIICAFQEEIKTFNSFCIFISIHMLPLGGKVLKDCLKKEENYYSLQHLSYQRSSSIIFIYLFIYFLNASLAPWRQVSYTANTEEQN